MSGDAVVALQGVGVAADGQDVLAGIDLEVADGETLVVLGESGSGKSTLVNVIADCVGFSGSVAKRADIDAATTGFCYDTFAAFAESRVRDIVAMYSRIRSAPVNGDMLRLFRLDEIEKRRFRALSAGERKRLSLYCALFFDPLLAVLDEPTEALDPMLRRAFWGVVEGRKGTTILASHLWQEALRSHDRVCLLAAGRMLGAARPQAEWLAAVAYKGRFAYTDAADGREAPDGLTTVATEDHTVVYFADDRERETALDAARGAAGGYSESTISLEDVYLLRKAGVA